MKATAATIQARVEDILRVRLDGAQAWDVREYVRGREKEGAGPWAIPEGGKPLSDSQLRRYAQRADELVRDSCRANRGKLLREHTAQRRNLYARAVKAGDVRTALAVLESLAKVLALFPSEVDRVEHKLDEVNQKLDRLEAAGGTGGGTEKAGGGNAGTGGAAAQPDP
jgi:hypothetical protein